MTSITLKTLYVNIVSSLLLKSGSKHWLFKKIMHTTPFLKLPKKIEFHTGDLAYNGFYAGHHSKDKSVVFIDNEAILKEIDKNHYDIFEKDFIELSQMTYFIFCYLFNPCNPVECYNERWAIFWKKISHDKITAFGRSGRLGIDLLISLNNNVIPHEFSNSLENGRKVPPIYSKFGMVFDNKGNEYKLLHYTVRKPNVKSHVSVVLLEFNNKKYYKLSIVDGFEYAELIKKTKGNDYFVFNFDEYKEYSTTSEFMADFSMQVIKGIYPEYTDNRLPMQQDKVILDMLVY